jgi:hypothetical protein
MSAERGCANRDSKEGSCKYVLSKAAESGYERQRGSMFSKTYLRRDMTLKRKL